MFCRSLSFVAVTKAVFVIGVVTFAVACTKIVVVMPAASVSSSHRTWFDPSTQPAPFTAVKVSPAGALSVTTMPVASALLGLATTRV